MVDFSNRKIEVFSGINDWPIPPNFMNNGLGSNGSYFVDKYNDLIEDLELAIQNNIETINNLNNTVSNLSTTNKILDGGEF